MYQFELEIGINSKYFFETVKADNQREALELGQLMYPEANYIEIA
jgi:hypothetical protein